MAMCIHMFGYCLHLCICVCARGETMRLQPTEQQPADSDGGPEGSKRSSTTESIDANHGAGDCNLYKRLIFWGEMEANHPIPRSY